MGMGTPFQFSDRRRKLSLSLKISGNSAVESGDPHHGDLFGDWDSQIIPKIVKVHLLGYLIFSQQQNHTRGFSGIPISSQENPSLSP